MPFAICQCGSVTQAKDFQIRNGVKCRKCKSRMKKCTFHAYRAAVLRSLGFKSYADYIASDFWADIRETILSRAGRVCQVCGQAAFVVHHDSYNEQVLRGNDLSRLYALCRDCHHDIEFKPDGRKRHRVTVCYVLRNRIRARKETLRVDEPANGTTDVANVVSQHKCCLRSPESPTCGGSSFTSGSQSTDCK